jgi:hypothetical protein
MPYRLYFVKDLHRWFVHCKENTDKFGVSGSRVLCQADRSLIGRVDAEAVKRDPKTETQHKLFSSLPGQWEQWVDRLRFQPARQATVASQDDRVATLRTMTIPPYTATSEQVEEISRESLAGMGYRMLRPSGMCRRCWGQTTRSHP